jgi:serine/threonine-protein kinase RsbW
VPDHAPRAGGTLRIASDPRRFGEARAWLAGLANAAGFDPGAIHDLSVALSEACANAHRHAYEGRTGGAIDIEAVWDGGAMRVAVRDYGVRFDPEAWRPPDLDDPVEGGYGVFLMRNVVDELRFRDAGDGMEVVMVKFSKRALALSGRAARSE